ncbi:MAG TPA: XkdF-like putative serine protease domain-containing protein [Ignavibacteriales bacterium]|nr:XkdF-like putative serine protease domain-containing protein [Ignavibacteriales bacterium]
MATRRLLDADVTFISLCGKGANKKTLIYKSQNTQAPTLQKTVQIKKVDSDEHKVYCIVYSPDETDSQGDTADKTAIEKMAYGFMKSGRNKNVDQDHDFTPDEGFIAESWILKTSDPVFPLEKEGSWAVCIKVENEETWQMVKDGEITGISMAAIAQVEEIPDETTDATVNKSTKQNKTGVVMKTFAEIKKFITDLFKTNTANVQKDLNSEVQSREVNSLVYALERVVYSIYENDDIEDKKLAVLESIDQLKNQVALVKFVTVEKAGKMISAANMDKLMTVKATVDEMCGIGGTCQLAADNPGCCSTCLACCCCTATNKSGDCPPCQLATDDPGCCSKCCVSSLCSAPNKDMTMKSDNCKNKSKKSEEEMKPEEIQKMIDEAVAPIKKENEALKTEVETLKSEKASLEKSLNERVEKIEKSTPGSQQQVPGDGGAPKSGMFI